MIKNNFCFTGYAAKDAEERITKLGLKIVSFSVPIKSRDDKTTWIQVSCFLDDKKPSGKYIYEDALRVKKGDYVYVEGPLSVDTYMNQDAIEKTTLKVSAYSLGIMQKKTDALAVSTPRASASDSYDDLLSDIPF